MRVLQIAESINPLQMPVAHELAQRLGQDQFRYCQFERSDCQSVRERVRMGWTCKASEPWILRPHESGADFAQMRQWWQDADVILCDNRTPRMLRSRLARNKFLFYQSERWWKPPIGRCRLLSPPYLAMAVTFRWLARSPWFHYLAIGRYAAEDMQRWVPLPGRSWLWGYFTAAPAIWPTPLPRGAEWRILNAGRMLAWKDVGTLIRAFAKVQQCRPEARLSIIGEGPTQAELRRLVGSLKLSGVAKLLPFQPQAEVWRHMRESHVYVLPSTGYEGWGAVLNEAMAQGCAIISSHATGAARTMLQHGENGMLFAPGDWQRLSELLVQLMDHDQLRLRLARAGQDTVAQLWSPGVAAERLLAVWDALLSRRAPPVCGRGPMTALGVQG